MVLYMHGADSALFLQSISTLIHFCHILCYSRRHYDSRRNSCKPMAELLTRENMLFTDQCMCVITKALPEFTEYFVGARGLCNMHRYGMEVLQLFSKIWYGSSAIVIRTNKRLAVCDACLRPPRTFPTGPARRAARFDREYIPSPC